jgi:CheY-like chemotaxis protein
MDINLGLGMNGIEATKRIRKIPGFESIPIVAVTAYAMAGDRETFLNIGCTHYISKPFTKREFISLIEEVLESIKK